MIYFIQDTISRAIKIGVAGDPQRRLASLQTGHPHLLILLGTVPGARKQEALLHKQFSSYRLKGEWFRGDADFFCVVQKLLMRTGQPCTVWDECERRGGCRYRLRGVEVAVLGINDVFKVYASHWDPDGKLRLTLYPANQPEPKTSYRNHKEGQLTVRASDRASDILGIDWPLGSQHNVLAEDCVLLSEWPVACCELS
jgi:hypothetical protein